MLKKCIKKHCPQKKIFIGSTWITTAEDAVKTCCTLTSSMRIIGPHFNRRKFFTSMSATRHITWQIAQHFRASLDHVATCIGNQAGSMAMADSLTLPELRKGMDTKLSEKYVYSKKNYFCGWLTKIPHRKKTMKKSIYLSVFTQKNSLWRLFLWGLYNFISTFVELP